MTAHTAAETITIREYYRNESGGGLLIHDWRTYVGAFDVEAIIVKLDKTRFGVEVTLALVAGTPRNYPWEAFMQV